MKTIHVLNPAAGQGGAKKYKNLENVYVTAPAPATEDYVCSVLEDTDEDINFKVYGGDGTVNEVVSGILRSGSDRGYLSVVPVGTGNDYVRSVAAASGDTVASDVLTLNDGYSINAINTGFDLEVVLKAAQYKKKPFISGPLAYILGVVSMLFGKLGKFMTVEYTDKDGNTDRFEGDCLLVVAGNGSYYGGGFKASPAADLTDGCIDLMIVKKVSRLKFISLVGSYKKGLHIDTKKLVPFDKFKDFIIFKKCKNVVIRGITNICADGEVFETDCAKIGIIPRAVKVLKTDKAVVRV